MAGSQVMYSTTITRHPNNPVLSAEHVPYPATCVFNAGVAKWQGRYVMLFRNDICDKETRKVIDRNLGLAWSDDGVDWEVEPEPVDKSGDHPLRRFYDPRLTVLDGTMYLCFATGLRGTRGGVAVATSDDLHDWEVLNISVPDNRNMAIFPERIDGKIVRLERPFAGYLREADRFDVWLSRSPEGRYWGDEELVLTCDELTWTNDKIGPGAPPVKTDKGWLALLHAVDRDDSRTWGWSGDWTKRYTIAVALLDLADPAKVLGYSRRPILVPEDGYAYEISGYRDHTLFPTGMVLEDDGEVKIYYGASDTFMALATCRVDELIALCEPVE